MTFLDGDSARPKILDLLFALREKALLPALATCGVGGFWPGEDEVGVINQVGTPHLCRSLPVGKTDILTNLNGRSRSGLLDNDHVRRLCSYARESRAYIIIRTYLIGCI